MKIGLLLVGFGNVGRRFVTLLDDLRGELAALDIDPAVVGVMTRRHGNVFDSAGLDGGGVAHRLAKGDAVGPASVPSALEWCARLRSQGVETHVLVETTTLDIRSGEPAISHVRAAFAAGAHVITANKGPVAFAGTALSQEAASAGVSFLFEGAVMDGVPVFNLVRETMPGVSIRGFRGVVNSTTNYILTGMEQGEPFDAALSRMQAAGIAEADPSLDVEGWDAAAKAAALANVLPGRGDDAAARRARRHRTRDGGPGGRRARRGETAEARRVRIRPRDRRRIFACSCRSSTRPIRSAASMARPTRSSSTPGRSDAL